MFTDGRKQKIFVQEKCMEHAFKVRESVCKNNKCKQTFGCTIYTRSDSAFTAGLPKHVENFCGASGQESLCVKRFRKHSL